MKKQEAIEHIKNKVGFLPYAAIIDLYQDQDDIPDELIKIECDYPGKPMWPPNTLFVGSKLYEKLREEGII